MLDTFQLLVELFCIVVLVSSAWQNPSMMITQCCMPTWAEWQHYANLNENTMPTWAEWEHYAACQPELDENTLLYASLSWMRTLCCITTWAEWKHYGVCRPELNENTMLYADLSWMRTPCCMPTWAWWCAAAPSSSGPWSPGRRCATERRSILASPRSLPIWASRRKTPQSH